MLLWITVILALLMTFAAGVFSCAWWMTAHKRPKLVCLNMADRRRHYQNHGEEQ